MANRRLPFAILATTILAAKGIHIYANAKALPAKQLRLWGYSFFGQDLLLLSVLRVLFGNPTFGRNRLRGSVYWASTLVAGLFATYSVIVGFASICFFAFSGSEIHYRNLNFVKDSSARAVLLSGLLSAALVAGAVLAVSWLFQSFFYNLFGLPADAATLCWTYLRNCIRGRRPLHTTGHVKYESLPSGEEMAEESLEKRLLDENLQSTTAWYLRYVREETIRAFGCLLAVAAVVTQITCLAIRPPESSLAYLSWTAPLLPFIDFDSSSPNLERLTSVYGTGIGHSWDNITALGQPPSFSWLPLDTKLNGFDDWYGDGKQHYSAKSDPLRSASSADELLPGLREQLRGVDIRHVMIIFLESTRKDVFPIKKDELIWDRFAETFEGKNVSPKALERLATLTPIANQLTGDYDDGFDHDATHAGSKPRGGVNFNNAYTSATYTKKSETGTLCGVHPLVADFNREFEHHIYQPCLPHILDAFNVLQNGSKAGDDYTSYDWRSYFMESTTINYDNSGPLFEAIGFPPENIISKEYLKKPSAKFGKVDLPDINYFGMEETPLRDYIRDAFVSAKKKDERVFLTHITSTSHHPYTMPANETYVPLGYKNALKDLSHYVNAVGYDDRWLGDILQVLEQEGVANETLIVFHGDHGISIPENDILASYYNPNVGCDRVPLVFSHPQLPSIQVDTPVSTTQVVPTILDLLAETQSLSESATVAARDLVNNFEGTSLVRATAPYEPDQEGQGLGNWQFVIMNPGRAMVGIRDRRREHWRLVVPVLANTVWRFTDLSIDPTEAHPTINFEFVQFLALMEEKHGLEAAQWAEEAAFIARWWVEENNKRWRFGPYAQ